MEVVENRTDDATMLPELLAQISEAEGLVTVTADGAYGTLYITKLLLSTRLRLSRVETANFGKGHPI